MQIEQAMHDKSLEKLEEIEELYKRALQDLGARISEWYQRFAINNEITPAEAYKLLNSAELAELRWTLEEYIAYGRANAITGGWVKELENASARVHIQRLEALKKQVRGELERLGNEVVTQTEEHIADTYTESLYRAAYEIQKGTGIGTIMLRLNADKVNTIIRKPWAVDGLNFSERLWTDKNKLINKTHNLLSQMVMTGGNPDKAIKDLAHEMKVSRSVAGRVIMTESAVFGNNAKIDAMKRNNRRDYEVVATLDGLTCEVCGQHDGEHYPIEWYEIGVTAPVYHPNCRCDVAPYMKDKYGDILQGVGYRATRDENGKSVLIPEMSYIEWKEKYLQ